MEAAVGGRTRSSAASSPSLDAAYPRDADGDHDGRGTSTRRGMPVRYSSRFAAVWLGHETLPFACRASLPAASSWRLRLSHVMITLASKRLNLAKVSPRATVTLYLAGSTRCATTRVEDVKMPWCARGSRLPVTITDLTGSGPDITVTDPSGRVLVDARGVHYSSIGTMAVCEGLLFGKKELGPGDVDLVSVFLDDP